MAETKSAEEPTLPAKRKSDLSSPGVEASPLKSQKLETEEKIEAEDQAQAEDHQNENLNMGASENDDSLAPEAKSGNEEPEIVAEDDEDEDYEDDEDDGDDEGLNGDAQVDRKGKGILIEEDDDSDEDDDDSSGGGNESDGGSDFEDDPLAEVDLDNILPSRTRRRATQPGVYIANDLGDNDDDDDSDDSDA